MSEPQLRREVETDTEPSPAVLFVNGVLITLTVGVWGAILVIALSSLL